MNAPPDLPAAAFLAALAGLPRLGPRRFQALLAEGDPVDVWQGLAAGRYRPSPLVAETLEPDGPPLLRRWQSALARIDVAAVWEAHLAAGIQVIARDDPRYPPAFAEDPDPPVVLFAIGDLHALDGLRVGVVGTRRCTQYGRDVASDLGTELAAAGVRVVSGLALGIDAAAHSGALSVDGAPPIGVVGNGPDVHYPRRNSYLYRAIRDHGVLLSEYPLGTQPRRWTFPARNRLVAALSRCVVVVETPEHGGSQHTIDEADRRDVDVLAVPGSVRSPASDGTNKLLWEGRQVARGARDVLDHLGVAPAPLRPPPTGPPPGVDPGPPVGAAPPDELRALLDAIGFEPVTLEQILLRTPWTLAEIHAGLTRLEELGWIAWQGSWVERRAGRGSR
jgi:DNA processing protein